MLNSKTCVLLTVITIVPGYPDNGTQLRSSVLSDINSETARRAKNKFEGYIVGGNFARIQDFPHSAFLAISCLKQNFEDFTCGSSILNQRILLTAAHCFEDCRVGTKVLVGVGAAKKTKGKFYSVMRFASHGQYNGDHMEHDIALALLTDPLTFNNNVKRVVLPSAGIYEGSALLSGWGVTDEDYLTDSLFLKWTRQKVWSRAECLRVVQIKPGYFCGTADSSNKQDYGYAAVGDSGSALMIRGFVQIGIVSYKISEISQSLIIYTDVWMYNKWIEHTAKHLYCQYH